MGWTRSKAWLLLAVMVLSMAAVVLSQPGDAPATIDPLQKPTARTLDCFEGGCHAEQGDFKVLHGPVSVGACDMCHSYVDAAEHTFELKSTKEELCEFCHIGQADGVVVHEPVAQKQCLECHDPHGANNEEILRFDNVGDLCSSCHDDVTRGHRYTHGPVATGSCSACHRSHTAEYENLLSATGRQLCLDCHEDMDRQIASVANVHKPVEGDCLQCHETHASSHVNHLIQEPLDLCVSCHEHENIKEMIDNVTVSHTPVTDERACLNCHASHGSNFDSLANDEGVMSCMACHGEPIIDEDGKTTVVGMGELLAAGANRHGPIRDGSCSGCHDVHGGSAPQLLVKPYPKEFYKKFEVETYALCFECHTSQLALQRKTDTVTDFRNGKANLHYVHVNRPKEGRSCRACHSTHASTNAMHIAETVPFGTWEMPVSFSPTPTGGECASGCHQYMAYDRDNPISHEPTEPVTEPAADTPEPAELPGPADAAPATTD